MTGLKPSDAVIDSQPRQAPPCVSGPVRLASFDALAEINGLLGKTT